MKSRILGATGLAALAVAFSVAGQSFSDSFEGPSLDPFWQSVATSPYVGGGGGGQQAAYPMAGRAHSGSQSLGMLEMFDGGGYVSHDIFPRLNSVDCSVWIYDEMAGGSFGSGYAYLSVNSICFGYRDRYTGGYCYQLGGSIEDFPTFMNRTVGWHKFEIHMQPQRTQLLIDGTTVAWLSTSFTAGSVRIAGRPGNNQSLVIADDFQFNPGSSDLVATSLTWDTADSGVKFSYEIYNQPLAKPTTAKLFWAKGTTTTEIMQRDSPITSIDIAAGSYGPGAGPLPAYLFEKRPAGATHVLLVLDPDNLITEAEESNNTKALALNLPVVVLVRGLQFPGSPATAAEYWSDASAYFSQDFDVWACSSISGKENIEVAANELHTFIQAKIDYRSEAGLPPLKKLSICAHSYGGLISRLYLLHRRAGQWSDDPEVSKVVMLSTPNCGSHAADLDSWCGWSPVGSEAALQCLTTAWVQSVFNRHCNDMFPSVPYYLFGGTGGYGSVRLFTPWWLLYNYPTGTVNPNDGVVTVMSAWGHRWLRSGTLYQDRQVGGAVRLTADDHSTITSSQSTLSQVRTILLGGANSGGSTFRQAKDGEEPPPIAALVATTNGTLDAGSSQQVSVPVDDCAQATFSLAHDQGQVTVTLSMPDGSKVDSATTNGTVHYAATTNAGGVNQSFVIDNPAVGVWTANLQGGTNLTSGIAWNLLVAEQSGLTIVPTTDYFQFAGKVAVSAALANGTQAMSGAVLSTAIQRPEGATDQLPLYDDGAHGDGAAADGVYANAYRGLPITSVLVLFP